MARKTKEESQKTRDGILDAAERVFLEKGVGTLAWTERLRDDPWSRAERMFRAGLDSLRSSPYLLLADA